jgi:hypothetical protein
MKNGFTNRFGWNRSGMDANAADAVGALNDYNGFAELSGIEGGLLAGRARTNNDQVVVCVRHLDAPRKAKH